MRCAPWVLVLALAGGCAGSDPAPSAGDAGAADGGVTATDGGVVRPDAGPGGPPYGVRGQSVSGSQAGASSGHQLRGRIGAALSSSGRSSGHALTGGIVEAE